MTNCMNETHLYASKAATYVRKIEKKKYTDILKVFRSQELLPVSLETCIQYGAVGYQLRIKKKYSPKFF